MAEGSTSDEQIIAAMPRCVGFILLHLNANSQNRVLIHDMQSNMRSFAVAAVAMAVRSQVTVRYSYVELITRSFAYVPERFLDALEPVATCVRP